MEHSTTRKGHHAAPAALLLSCLCLSVPTAHAHLPEVFGYDYVRAEDDSEDRGSGSQPAVDMSGASPLDLAAYMQKIQEREKADGPYASGLAEPLTLLGLYYRQRGDYEGARKAHQRALHVSRVNDGLTSNRQLPILRELITLYKLTGDYESLDGAYRYYERVRGLRSPPHKLEDLRASLEYLDWQREAYSYRRDGSERRHLLQAYLLNREILDAMAAQPDVEYDWYREMTMSQLGNLYLLMGVDPSRLRYSGTFGGADGADERVDAQVAAIQELAISKGKVLLQDLIGRSEDRSTEELASIYLELGDWYQWNGEYRRAKKQYAQVVALLEAAGEEDLLRSWLDQPIELPDERSLWREPPGPPHLHRPVTVSYRVSARGEARAIQVEAVDEAEATAARRLKRLLRETHFRPRFSQGRAERSGQVTRSYRLID